MWLPSLLCLLIPALKALYILHTKNITVRTGSFYTIDFFASSDDANTQIKPIGNISITKQFQDSSLFDVFVLYSQEQKDCYMHIYYNSSWEQSCQFLYNNSESFLRRQNFSLYYKKNNMSNQNLSIIIDNTYFPLKGSAFQDPLMLYLSYEQLVDPNTTYFQWTIKLFIVFVCVFVCFLIWCLVMFYRYKKEKQKIQKLPAVKGNVDFETNFRGALSKKKKIR